MFGIFNKPRTTEKPEAPVSVRPPETLAGTQNPDLLRELARLVLKTTLRQNGIPADWLTCDVQVSLRQGREEIHVLLFINTWNEQLLKYTFALGNVVLRELQHFDPVAFHAGCVVSWRYAAHYQSPYDHLPNANDGPSNWQSLAPEEPNELPLFDRRRTPRPPGAPVYSRDTPPEDDFESTTISPLR